MYVTTFYCLGAVEPLNIKFADGGTNKRKPLHGVCVCIHVCDAFNVTPF